MGWLIVHWKENTDRRWCRNGSAQIPRVGKATQPRGGSFCGCKKRVIIDGGGEGVCFCSTVPVSCEGFRFLGHISKSGFMPKATCSSPPCSRFCEAALKAMAWRWKLLLEMGIRGSLLLSHTDAFCLLRSLCHIQTSGVLMLRKAGMEASACLPLDEEEVRCLH